MLIIVIACVPVIGTVAVVVSTSEPDLSEVKPLKQTDGDDPVLDWARLRQDHSRAMAAGSPAFSGAQVRALGYITDGDQPIPKGNVILRLSGPICARAPKSLIQR
jgi:hypothetical protein